MFTKQQLNKIKSIRKKVEALSVEAGVHGAKGLAEALWNAVYVPIGSSIHRPMRSIPTRCPICLEGIKTLKRASNNENYSCECCGYVGNGWDS